jgi:hypothetical protein
VKCLVVDVTLMVLEDPISRGVSRLSKDARLSRVTRAKALIGVWELKVSLQPLGVISKLGLYLITWLARMKYVVA